ncbi:MAG TPA: phosphoadenylyl-sulfate reductase [Polyangia bacterium]|nr:phosphoadenylyl-sulfate reductase [Polyangia bacterium]
MQNEERFAPAALRARSAALETATPEEILRLAFDTYDKIAISTAFGPEGCALVHLAWRIRPEVKVFTVDTGFLFEESLELRRRFVERYGIRLEVLEGTTTLAEQEERHGPRLYERDPDTCCALRKVEPTARALVGLEAWIAGLRRDQAKTRTQIDILERYDHDDGSPLVKVNPLARWTRRDTWQYLLANDVPYNPLLDQGYKSIGCWPCTQPVAPDADERSGRWGGQKQECGIHTFMIRKS